MSAVATSAAAAAPSSAAMTADEKHNTSQLCDDAALKLAAPGRWSRGLSDASTSLPEDDAGLSRQTTAAATAAEAAAAEPQAVLPEAAPDDSHEADLGASAAVSLALVALAAGASLCFWPAAFPGFAALGLVLAAVIWLTAFPCGVPRGSAAAREGTGDDDCVVDSSYEKDLGASVATSLALVAAAAALAYFVCDAPAVAAGLAVLDAAMLAAAWLTGMPCGVPRKAQEDSEEEDDLAATTSVSLVTTIRNCAVCIRLLVALAISICLGLLALTVLPVMWLTEMPSGLPRLASDGDDEAATEDGDMPPPNSKGADRAALLSVSLAVAVLAAAPCVMGVFPGLAAQGETL